MSPSTPDRSLKGGDGALQNPALLLVITGFLIGLNFPLGKLAGAANISPLIWALVVSFGASALLLPVLLFKGNLRKPTRQMVRYVTLSALVSYVIPNILLFAVIPRAGSGYTGLMFALSPVFTLTIATLFKLKAPNWLGLTGIAIGLLGATIVSITRGSAPEAPQVIWIIAALLIPLSLACGNVYRTLDWPDGASPNQLAFWSHAFAVAVYLALLFVSEGSLPLGDLAAAPWAALAQAVVAGLTFPVFFRLQQRGGPVLLSQIGYVAATVGMIAATLFLGEVYSPATWAGAGVIALGIAITIWAQLAKPAVPAVQNG
ncbi:DMT family transporter [Rhodovibrionaceae bacterium A322]